MLSGERTKQVMLAAYYFPPMASVSWMRVTKFAKYLPSRGWVPMVATVDARYYPKVVEGELPPEVGAFQVRRFPYLPWVSVHLAKVLFPFYILLNAIKFRHSLDAVILFGSPFHPFLIAPLLRYFTALPLVLDLRDGWSTWHEQTDDEGLLNIVVNRARRFIERTGFRSACKVVFATEILRKQYTPGFPSYRHKFVTVSNGSDPDDFEFAESARDADEKPIQLAGKSLFYTPDVARRLWEVLAEHPGWRFVSIGEESDAMIALARQAGAEAQVSVKGYLPYREVLREVRRAGLCVTSNSFSEGLGTKVFDYLALGKRVLCFVPAVSEIAEQFEEVVGVTICHEPHSRDQVAAGLAQALTSEPVSTDCVVGFSRSHKALELAGFLDGCLAGPDPSARRP